MPHSARRYIAGPNTRGPNGWMVADLRYGTVVKKDLTQEAAEKLRQRMISQAETIRSILKPVKMANPQPPEHPSPPRKIGK